MITVKNDEAAVLRGDIDIAIVTGHRRGRGLEGSLMSITCNPNWPSAKYAQVPEMAICQSGSRVVYLPTSWGVAGSLMSITCNAGDPVPKE